MKKHLQTSLTISCLSLVLLVVSIILHNYLSGLAGQEEPFFFALSMILVFVFPLSILYNLIVVIAHFAKKSKN